MAKDIFVLVQYNKTSGKFSIDYFPEAIDTKQFTTNLIEAEPNSDIVLSSFFVNPDKKKVSNPDIKFYKKPHPPIIIPNPGGFFYNYNAFTNPLFAPEGWHVPTEQEFETFFNSFNYSVYYGSAAKKVDPNFWVNQYSDDNNASGYSALGSGFINSFGNITEQLTKSIHACTNLVGGINYKALQLINSSDNYSYINLPLNNSSNVRFIKNDSILPAFMEDYQGNKYNCIKIGNIVITTENYKCSVFSDLSPITKKLPSNNVSALNEPYYFDYLDFD